ncbi:NAD(+)/NADH kinase [Oceanirhabdus sp. W0125-5]|uniref:NAD(+)/NADH kinase n=1 Tax=Oceanirhabdus sp. W0125-5 TaxID=2999116 RepID=UPI0022F2E2C6|nr:NAD(+)/NADH kinase [Oceanirhabdus sp. W0125-5]WBW98388.1 NAD(+)/NADH kinase [Oceanirhabdus sp. W0125-5]
MRKNIRRIRIYSNKLTKSIQVCEEVTEKLKNNGFEIVKELPDLVVCVGGDGTFIHALKTLDFDTEAIYVGIHTGHLGFLQEINTQDIDYFIECLKNSNYKIEQHRIQETRVTCGGISEKFHSFNEVVIRDENLKVLHIEIKIDENSFERFSGDGIIISTPIGSTAYNMSAGGGLVFPSLDVLQLMPLAPLNSGAYRCITNSILVPPDKIINILPLNRKNISICIDGEVRNFKCVESIQSMMSPKYIKMLRLENYSFWTRIQEKFL